MNFFGFLTPLFQSFTASSVIPSIIATICVLYGLYTLKRLLDV